MVLAKSGPVNRLGIFFFFDKDGVADPYIKTLLDGMRPHLSQLLVVSNGPLAAESRALFDACADKVLERENKELDVGAYRDGMALYGWDALGAFDEVVLFNFTIFGPLYPFAETFDKMDGKDLDFWGITVGNGAYFDPYGKTGLGYLPPHLQSHFIAVRKPMLQSKAFQNHWDEMPEIKDYSDSVCYHEVIFTKKFEELGFSWQASVDTTDIDCAYTTFPLMMMPVELIKNRRCPIIKRRSFFQFFSDYLENTMGEPAAEALACIRENCDYDVDQIYGNLLRCCNQADLKNCLQHNYVLPSQALLDTQPKARPRVALLMHLFSPDLISYCRDYAASMPGYADIYVSTNTEEKKALITEAFSSIPANRLEVRVIPNRGRDVSALLVGFRDLIDQYDYICFAHDKKGSSITPKVAGDSFSYLCFEGILKSPDYVENIIHTFQANPRLGLLTPPPPIHSRYYGILGHEWSTNFEGCKKLARQLGLHVDMDLQKEPIAPLGSEFWFRAKALKPLFDHGFSYEDFPDESYYANPAQARKEHLSHHIERIHPFVVQSEGYYPAWVMPESLAGMEVTMLNYYGRQMNQVWPNGLYPIGRPFAEQIGHMKANIQKLDEANGTIAFLKGQIKAWQKNARWHSAHLANAQKNTAWLQRQMNDLMDVVTGRKGRAKVDISAEQLFTTPLPWAARVKLAIKLAMPRGLYNKLAARFGKKPLS